ncbi:GNAT domain-containing protein [Colletotrichum lupini]|nr:GNAT domain-containing protein [Colletotrichum lupini]
MSLHSPRPDLWLEPLDPHKHLQGFHELCSDEKANLWSTRLHTTTLEASKERIVVNNPETEPWHLSCAVMVSDYASLPPLPAEGGNNGVPATDITRETKMIGSIRTTTVSAWGLSIGYKLRSDCWGKGYATRAIAAFLDMYWSRMRLAPRREMVVVPEVRSSATGEGDDDDGDQIEITHLVAQVDLENVGSMRVCEKCGGRLVAVEKECIKVWRFAEMRDMAVWRFDKPSDSVSSQA